MFIEHNKEILSQYLIARNIASVSNQNESSLSEHQERAQSNHLENGKKVEQTN